MSAPLRAKQSIKAHDIAPRHLLLVSWVVATQDTISLRTTCMHGMLQCKPLSQPQQVINEGEDVQQYRLPCT